MITMTTFRLPIIEKNATVTTTNFKCFLRLQCLISKLCIFMGMGVPDFREGQVEK